jgi:hypothetical protein
MGDARGLCKWIKIRSTCLEEGLTTLLWYTLYVTTDNTVAVHNTKSPISKYKHLLLNLGTIILINIVSMFRQTVHVFGHCENAMELDVNIFTPT